MWHSAQHCNSGFAPLPLSGRTSSNARPRKPSADVATLPGNSILPNGVSLLAVVKYPQFSVSVADFSCFIFTYAVSLLMNIIVQRLSAFGLPANSFVLIFLRTMLQRAFAISGFFKQFHTPVPKTTGVGSTSLITASFETHSALPPLPAFWTISTSFAYPR